MGHDYPQKKGKHAVWEGMVGYARVLEGFGGFWRVLEGFGGFWRVLEGLGAFEGGVVGGMGHDFPEKWTNFLNRPVASTSLTDTPGISPFF